MRRHLLALFLASASVGLALDAGAQQLRDPTRPPARLASASGDGTAAPRSAGLSLQSVLIAPDRRSAIIDGSLLQIGDSISGFKVMKIEEEAVTLRGAAGIRRLQLFPEVEKRRSLTVRPALPEPAATQGGEKPAATDTKREDS
jgi:MSHA biogenesis protein MshK